MGLHSSFGVKNPHMTFQTNTEAMPMKKDTHKLVSMNQMTLICHPIRRQRTHPVQ